MELKHIVFGTKTFPVYIYTGGSSDRSGLPWFGPESVLRNSSTDIKICFPYKGMLRLSFYESINPITLPLVTSHHQHLNKKIM
jgi:hypothetical protein